MTTPRSIFDEGMSTPVVRVRPRPQGIALTEDALAQLMADEAQRLPHMRAGVWRYNDALPPDRHPCGLPGVIDLGTVHALVWHYVNRFGPCRLDQVQDGLRLDRFKAHNAVDRLCRRKLIFRIGRGGPHCRFTTQEPQR